MAELLILAKDTDGRDPNFSWSRGHVIAIKPDGWEWGKEEIKPEKFTIVKLPGVSIDDVQNYERGRVEEVERQRDCEWSQWQKAQIDAEYMEFLSRPTVMSTRDEPLEVLVRKEKYDEEIDKSKFGAFYGTPTVTAMTMPDGVPGYKLTGIMRIVTLFGTVIEQTRIRDWKLNLDVLPKEIIVKDLEEAFKKVE